MRSIKGFSLLEVPKRNHEELAEVSRLVSELAKLGCKMSNLYCGGTRIAVVALPGFVVDEERREIKIYDEFQRDKVSGRSKKSDHS